MRQGIPIESLTSLKALLDPDVAEKIIDSYWKQDGEEPSVYTIDLAWKFLSIARATGCLDAAALERLDELRAALEIHRRGGLTEKNQAVVRQVLSAMSGTEC